MTQRDEEMVLFIAKATEAMRAIELLKTENDTYENAKRVIDDRYTRDMEQLNGNFMQRVSGLVMLATERIEALTPAELQDVSLFDS